MKPLTKFKIPTLLGLGIIFIGIAVGVFLVLREQTFFTSAAQSTKPEIIYDISNIEDSSVVISWKTSIPALGFVTYGVNDAGEQTALDDRDSVPQLHQMHYVTIKNLLPKTEYKYRIVSGKIKSDISRFTTASQTNNKSQFNPVIGSADQDNKPIPEGIAFLTIPGAKPESALIKNLGNFLIPLTGVREEDKDIEAKVTIVAPTGQATAVFLLKQDGVNLPLLNIGDNLDLTIAPSPTPTPAPDLTIYDLNKDKKINSADYSLAQKNKNKKLSSVRTDLTTDRVIDDDYLKELSKMITTSQNSNQ